MWASGFVLGRGGEPIFCASSGPPRGIPDGREVRHEVFDVRVRPFMWPAPTVSAGRRVGAAFFERRHSGSMNLTGNTLFRHIDMSFNSYHHGISKQERLFRTAMDAWGVSRAVHLHRRQPDNVSRAAPWYRGRPLHGTGPLREDMPGCAPRPWRTR
jgi:hypothetical protein